VKFKNKIGKIGEEDYQYFSKLALGHKVIISFCFLSIRNNSKS